MRALRPLLPVTRSCTSTRLDRHPTDYGCGAAGPVGLDRPYLPLLHGCRLGRIHPFRVRDPASASAILRLDVGLCPVASRSSVIDSRNKKSLPAWPGSGQDHRACARFTDSIAPLLRFDIPLQRLPVASRVDWEMPTSNRVPLRRWLMSLARFPKSPCAQASSLRFSAFAKLDGCSPACGDSVKCFPIGSTLLITRAPSPQGRRSKRRGVTVMSADRLIAQEID